MPCSPQVAGHLVPCGVIRHSNRRSSGFASNAWFLGHPMRLFLGLALSTSFTSTNDRLPKEARGMFLLFQGENFVSYAGYGGATANTMRITGVFTPAEFRGRGYGQLICWYVSWWTGGTWLNHWISSSGRFNIYRKPLASIWWFWW